MCLPPEVKYAVVVVVVVIVASRFKAHLRSVEMPLLCELVYVMSLLWRTRIKIICVTVVLMVLHQQASQPATLHPLSCLPMNSIGIKWNEPVGMANKPTTLRQIRASFHTTTTTTTKCRKNVHKYELQHQHQQQQHCGWHVREALIFAQYTNAFFGWRLFRLHRFRSVAVGAVGAVWTLRCVACVQP